MSDNDNSRRIEGSELMGVTYAHFPYSRAEEYHLLTARDTEHPEDAISVTFENGETVELYLSELVNIVDFALSAGKL